MPLTPDTWTKSTHSGEGNCVYVKSSHSAEGACVEVARHPNSVTIRDSKDPHGPTLTFTHPEWNACLAGTRDGEFDL